MHSVTAQEGVELLDLQLFRLELLVTRGRVAGRRFTFLTRFRAFNCDDFSCHKLIFFFCRLFQFLHQLIAFVKNLNFEIGLIVWFSFQVVGD